MIFVLSFLSLTFMDNLTAIAVIFICLFCLYLYYDNKKLNKIIDELKLKNKNEYEKNVFKEDIISIDNISKDIKEIEMKKAIAEEKKEDIVLVESKKKDEGIDEKFNKDNINNNMVEVVKTKNSKKKSTINSNNIKSEQIKFNIDDFIKKDNIYRKLDSSNMNRDYLTEVSRELSNNMEPQTIELTAYEQEQEDNAIISYKELLDANKKEEVINDGTVEFIEELKKFRNNLRK